MVVRRILTGALLAPLLMVSACGGGDSSVADPPVSPTTASSSPTGQPQRETPKAFIRRWTIEEKRMENTGETGDYLDISRGCAACQKLATQVKGFYAAGGFVRWGGWKILSIKANSTHGKTITYAVRNKSLPTTYREAGNAPVKHLSGGVTTELLALEVKGKSWNLVSKAELAS
jgi:hypothetical protein